MSAAFTGVDGKPQIPGRGTGNRYPARGERSVLNGKPVVADGKGNWVDGSKPMVPMSERPTVGNYNPGLRFPSVKAIQAGEYGSSGSKDEKATAPPEADKPRGQNLPPSAAVPGTGPEGNKVGSDADPDTPGLQGPGAVKPGGRVNANGLVSYGKDLSSLNKFTSAFTGGYELTDIKSAFQSNDLNGAYQNGSNTISTDESKYTLPDGATPSNVGGKYTMDGVDIPSQSTGYELDSGSLPGKLGGNPSDPQDGTSSKPDVAESIRTVRMRRKGPRDEGSFRGFQIDQANEFAQNSVSETKGNGMNARRREIRGTFLNHEGNSIQAITAARSVAGVGNDSNGSDVYNVGGELVYAKPGEERKAINAAMSGHNPMAHLDMPGSPASEQTETTLDLSKVDVKSDTFTQVNKEAQEFLKGKLGKTK